MKSLLVKLGVILIGLAIFGNAEAWGADWKLYSNNENFIGYCDTQSITRLSKNIVRVWVRWDWKEKGKLDMLKDFGKIMENLSHSKLLIEIDCVEKKNHRLSWTDYDNKGKMIDSISSPSEWDFITPETVAESLYKAVCK